MTDESKPKDLAAYKKWLREKHGVEIDDRASRYYETAIGKAIMDVQKSTVWSTLLSDLNRINQAYFIKTNYYLFVTGDAPSLVAKPFSSVIEKSFRKNVLLNRRWPNEPKGGWVFPTTWYGQINDLIRTCFVVKYLDGVNYLCGEFERRVSKEGLENRTYMEAREEGYYAAHFYFKIPCEIPKENWDTREEVISVELQVTTQLQEVIRRLLHSYYESKRSSEPENEKKWQWDYKSDEFSANYLGHILHYVEGMIMDVRDNKVRSKE